MSERFPKAETGGGGGDECSKPTVERREGKRDERSTGTRAEQRAGGLQGISSSERAALLSARIHREVNAGRFVLGLPVDTYDDRRTGYFFQDQDGRCSGCALGAAAFALGAREYSEVFAALDDFGMCAGSMIEAGFEATENFDASHPYVRLGAELRAIVLGNRGTT